MEKLEQVYFENVSKFRTEAENVKQFCSVKLVGGGDEVPFFSETSRFLTYHEAADILHQNIKDSVTTEPPYRTSAGRVYLYSDDGDRTKKEDWKADGYTWRNYGTKKYLCDGMEIEKTSFKIINNKEISDKFQKHAFSFTDQYNGKTVIVYMGDSEAYQNMLHGNRKETIDRIKDRNHL